MCTTSRSAPFASLLVLTLKSEVLRFGLKLHGKRPDRNTHITLCVWRGGCGAANGLRKVHLITCSTNQLAELCHYVHVFKLN